MVIKAIDFKVEEIGESVKMTKKRYVWIFEIDGKQHTVELHHSLLTGRIRVFSNNSVLYDESRGFLDSTFQFPFVVDVNMLNLLQHGDTFELRINNQVFAHLYNQEKMRREFGGSDEPYAKKDVDIDDDRKKRVDKAASGKFWDENGLGTKENKKSEEESKGGFRMKPKNDIFSSTQGKGSGGLTSEKASTTQAKSSTAGNFTDFSAFANFAAGGSASNKAQGGSKEGFSFGDDISFSAKSGGGGGDFSSFGLDGFGDGKPKAPVKAKVVDLLDLDDGPVAAQPVQQPVKATGTGLSFEDAFKADAKSQPVVASAANNFANFEFGGGEVKQTPTNTPIANDFFGQPTKPTPTQDMSSLLMNAYNAVPMPAPSNPFGNPSKFAPRKKLDNMLVGGGFTASGGDSWIATPNPTPNPYGNGYHGQPAFPTNIPQSAFGNDLLEAASTPAQGYVNQSINTAPQTQTRQTPFDLF